ncbi:uncharacterized protein LOC127585904 [Pristis pectinata]|uniref:uncharacterized protein LOC127585904 n=1 Tax=Pristis pectinata TaxID=685728 RepID=UPI00223CF280|nr:uncharacterized protein LOC127585904 [Pristis pectinata]
METDIKCCWKVISSVKDALWSAPNLLVSQLSEMSVRERCRWAQSRQQESVLRDALKLGAADAKALWGRRILSPGLFLSNVANTSPAVAHCGTPWGGLCEALYKRKVSVSPHPLTGSVHTATRGKCWGAPSLNCSRGPARMIAAAPNPLHSFTLSVPPIYNIHFAEVSYLPLSPGGGRRCSSLHTGEAVSRCCCAQVTNCPAGSGHLLLEEGLGPSEAAAPGTDQV